LSQEIIRLVCFYFFLLFLVCSVLQMQLSGWHLVLGVWLCLNFSVVDSK
jgi:hypothetical protein